MRSIVLALAAVAALAAPAQAFAPGASLPTIRRAAPAVSSAPRMQQVDLLDKVEQLKLLSAINKAGVLSKIERAGLLSKLEASGALSAAEKVLPLLDENKVISLTKAVVNIPAGTFYAAAAAVAGGELAALLALPNDTPFIVLKAVTGLAAIPLAVGLVIGGQLNGVIQGNQPVNLMSIFGPRLRD